MAKTTRIASTLPAFNAQLLFGAAIESTMTGGDADTAKAAAATHVAGRSLVDVCQAFLLGETMEVAIAAGKQAAADGARALLAAQGVDVAEFADVRTALIPAFWTLDGQAGTPTAKAAGDAPTDDAKKAAKAIYQRAYMRAERMAQRIIGDVAAEAVAVKVPKALQAEIDAMQARIVALKAEHGAAVVAEARSRSAEKAKKAKAKAAAAK
jgi:hypothetical protein